ncbi:MAG: hypothetical protein LBR53_11185 [Deltaproteobacteria bacterium]|jgi:hypothetical protein|nr:hypothetical protein [Deltaproteobacteria bacterium]
MGILAPIFFFSFYMSLLFNRFIVIKSELSSMSRSKEAPQAVRVGGVGADFQKRRNVARLPRPAGENEPEKEIRAFAPRQAGLVELRGRVLEKGASMMVMDGRGV